MQSYTAWIACHCRCPSVRKCQTMPDSHQQRFLLIWIGPSFNMYSYLRTQCNFSKLLSCQFWGFLSLRLKVGPALANPSGTSAHARNNNEWIFLAIEVGWFRPWIRIRSQIFSYEAIPDPDSDPVKSRIITPTEDLGSVSEVRFWAMWWFQIQICVK